MSGVAIYPGSFDPITFGHIDLIERATTIFDNVIVAVANNTAKTPMFALEERLDMIRQTTGHIPNLSIESFSGLVVDYARSRNARVLIRGLRMISDFEYEFQMALTNRRLADDIETVFLMPSENFAFVSSTLLKEAASLGADVSSFVPPPVAEKLKNRPENP